MEFAKKIVSAELGTKGRRKLTELIKTKICGCKRR
jgi:hypothetical protein